MATVNCNGGQWGGNDGGEWSYVPKGEICGISITYGDVINTIRFTSQDEFGNLEYSRRFGNEVGSNKADIDFNPKVKKLNGITGTVGNYGDGVLVVTSLSFTTDKDTRYGPFGKATGTTFSSKILDDQIISGFYVRSGELLNAIGVYLHCIPKLSVGPWGSHESGNQWTYEPKGVISGISITHDDAIYSIGFTSVDEKGNAEKSRTFGATRGSKSDEVVVDIDNERLNDISGTFGVKDGLVVVTSLSFSTDKNTIFGPFGTARGTSFSLLVKEESLIGFHGRSDQWLDAIGVYLRPITEKRFGRWGSRLRGNEWNYAPKGAISHMSITHDDAIYSISFTSIDDDGKVDHSRVFGEKIGSESSEIEIDFENEKLNNICGTVDHKDGLLVVTSLSFFTDKETSFGPFGTVRGTAFSLRVNNGVFSGFHGRSGWWLDGFGVIVKPT